MDSDMLEEIDCAFSHDRACTAVRDQSVTEKIVSGGGVYQQHNRSMAVILQTDVKHDNLDGEATRRSVAVRIGRRAGNTRCASGEARA